MSAHFDQGRHQQLLDILARSSFGTDYQALCRRYATRMDVDHHGPDLGLILASFRHGGVAVELSKRFKTFAFDPERIGDWCWTGKLVVQRHGVLEPMLDGVDISQTLGVGSTWLSLALDSGARRTPPIAPTEFLPPALPVNRPCYDGEPATIDRLIPDLISLLRATKDVIRASSW